MNKRHHKKSSLFIHEGERSQRSIIRKVLSSIIKVKARIHRVQLSGNYSYTEIDENLGHLKLANNSQIAKRRRNQYKTTAYCQLKDANLIVHTNRQKGCLPKSMIQLTSPSLKTLFFILNALPKLIISSVEYTIDMYCKEPQEVVDLFYVLRRHSYFHDAAETFIIGGDFYGWREPRNTNRVYKITFKTSAKNIKCYERGNDNNQQDDYSWDIKDINRVRIEATIYRKSNIFRRNGIFTLYDFIMNPKFFVIFFNPAGYDEIQFKTFRASSKLPGFGEDYKSEDEDGNAECFQEEYLHGKQNKIKNISQYMVDAPGFDKLRQLMVSAVVKFEKRRCSRAQKLIQLIKGTATMDEIETFQTECHINELKLHFGYKSFSKYPLLKKTLRDYLSDKRSFYKPRIRRRKKLMYLIKYFVRKIQNPLLII